MKLSATKLPGLEAFADQIFEGVDGQVTLNDYSYFDCTPVYASVRIPVRGGQITSGSEFVLFGTDANRDDNLTDGNWGKLSIEGMLPSNMAFVAMATEFDVFRVTATGRKLPLCKDDLFQTTHACTWSWNVGGVASPTLQYGPISACLRQPEKMSFPLFFPPYCPVNFLLTFQETVGGLSTDDTVQVMARLRGYTLSRAI